MFCNKIILGQSSFALNGLWNINNKSTSLLNGLDNNPSNYLLLKDWGLTFSYGSEFSEPISSNLYLVSLSKRIENNYFTFRYTPGFQKDFVFNTGNSIIFEDSSVQSLSSKFSYKEILGFGYSYNFSSKFSAGFSIRYFTQEFNHENFKPILIDTLYYLEREIQTEKSNFWKGDIGLNYFFNDQFSVSLSSMNLFNFSEQSSNLENETFKIRNDKAAVARLSFSPVNNSNLNFLYETNNSFQLGMSQNIPFDDGNIGLSLSVLHDKLQTPFINGISFGLSYSNNFWGAALFGVKYFNDRNKPFSYSEFKSTGISNLTNNKYSFDKAILSFSITLNALREKKVEFVSVEVVKEIFPTFNEVYIDSPFAFGRVINLTNKSVFVKPMSKIEGFNDDYIQSNAVTIHPKDTALVPFFTITSDYFEGKKPTISKAYFTLFTDGDEPDDIFQSPILLNGLNSWDGQVKNLRFFIKRDLDFSMNFSKSILSKFKNNLDTINSILIPFYKAKFIFDDLVKELVYVSDPRASTEYVQFPHETIKIKGGDCDDLSVCFSSLLESIGIETALIDYKTNITYRHVNVLLNTHLTPDNARLITDNDSKYFIRKDENGKDEIWIPIETTSLTNFNTAWEIGAEKFFSEAVVNYGLVTGKAEIVDVY